MFRAGVPSARILGADSERRNVTAARVDGEDRLRLARVAGVPGVVGIPVHVDARARDDQDRRDLDATVATSMLKLPPGR